MIIHADISVIGQVQGVGFRRAIRKKAVQLRLCGWVQNWDDGTVHIEVEGELKQLDVFTAWLRTGTMLARVHEIRIHTDILKQYVGFEIKHTSL